MILHKEFSRTLQNISKFTLRWPFSSTMENFLPNFSYNIPYLRYPSHFQGSYKSQIPNGYFGWEGVEKKWCSLV